MLFQVERPTVGSCLFQRGGSVEPKGDEGFGGICGAAGLGATGRGAGATGTARGGVAGIGTARGGGAKDEDDEVAVTSLRENSAVSLRYQINAPPPITATKVKKTSRMPRQDFMGGF